MVYFSWKNTITKLTEPNRENNRSAQDLQNIHNLWIPQVLHIASLCSPRALK